MDNRTDRIDLLDYLKAVCAMLVITTHYSWEAKNHPVFTMFINMAVPVFMLLTGYNFASSNARHTDGTFCQMYDTKSVRKKFRRFVQPFIVIWLVEISILIYKKYAGLPMTDTLDAVHILFHRCGPGSYYVPIMIQMLVIFPIIYRLVISYKRTGVVIVGAINLLYEIGVAAFHMMYPVYRVCLNRYLFLIALGCYLYVGRHTEIQSERPRLTRLSKIGLSAMFIIGVIYAVKFATYEYSLPIFLYWTPTDMPISFYIYPIIVVLFYKCYHVHMNNCFGNLLSVIGKSSYHIFLFQMMYYEYDLGGNMMLKEWYIAVPYNMVICITLGVLFRKLENRCNRLFAHLWEKYLEIRKNNKNQVRSIQ